MVSPLRKRLTVGLFAASIFTSAFLLFQVQPLMGKYVLPWFGGSPGVWTTCMLFFQVTLFAGYCYAHVLSLCLSVKQQVRWHCLMLLLTIPTLPITPGMHWKPSGGESPTWQILVLLACKVGLPYFLLSSTGPLLQSWLGRTKFCESSYRLYSLSNVGSMLALLTFPFMIEPSLSSSQQSAMWSWAFACFVLLCSLSGMVLIRALKKQPRQRPAMVPAELKEIDSVSFSSSFSWKNYAGWFMLPALASVLLLATTNQLCIDTGSVPFLWIAPLAAYLLSFIITFDSDRWYNRRMFILLAASCFLALYSLKLIGAGTPLTVEISLYICGLFACCVVCHGEVVATKPDESRMTSFYLTLSAGGAFGGILVGLIAPTVFRGYFEWQLALLACILLFVDLYLQYIPYWQVHVTAKTKALITASILSSTLVILSTWDMLGEQQLASKRNFYGVLSVRRQVNERTGDTQRNLVHGRIIHGSQYEDDTRRLKPTTYYTPQSGVGMVLQGHKAGSPRTIGIVGLGAGTLAAYGQPQDRIRFYEINPDVIQLAQQHFSFLSSTPAKVDLVIGDARLMLERESSQKFDILVLDAFSGDAIPVHLLTSEAMTVYDFHLKSDGVLAFHISNLYFDLGPIATGLAESKGYQSKTVYSVEDLQQSALCSTWVLMSRNSASLDSISPVFDTSTDLVKPVLWTDDRNNLFQAIR